MKFPIPDSALTQHTAVLGKTGSGKTSTAKTIVEHLVAQGARVCILDPIKSDWWGLTSSADGKRPGLPFHILGGPRGHVPLHAASGKAIAEIVANGTLPLSIIDMADFAPGGQAKFFIEFAPALLRRMRGVVHLVMEEAHLFAPKERSGVGDENMAIHWAKMLATAGRSKGVRMILVTQRTQALHNAMLGSCETMVAHRLTAPADQKPLIDWLKANTAKDIVEKVSGSLASLKTGTAWVCSGEAKFFELVTFPRIATYDNSATPAAGDLGQDYVRTAPVDVERLRAIVGDAAKEAEANDPKALKAEVARLTAEIKKLNTSKPVEKINTADLDKARAEGREEGYLVGHHVGAGLYRVAIKWAQDQAEAKLKQFRTALIGSIGEADGLCSAQEFTSETVGFAGIGGEKILRQLRNQKRTPVPTKFKPLPKDEGPGPQRQGTLAKPAYRDAQRARNAETRTLVAAVADGLSTPQRRVLASLGFWASVGHESPSRPQVAAVAGYVHTSGSFRNTISSLNVAGLINAPDAGRLALVGEYEAMSADEARAKLLSILGGPERKIVEALSSGETLSREELGVRVGYEPTSGSFRNTISALNVLNVLTKPSAGSVAMTDWAREILV